MGGIIIDVIHFFMHRAYSCCFCIIPFSKTAVFFYPARLWHQIMLALETDLETHFCIGFSFEANNCLHALITLLNNFEHALKSIFFVSKTELSSNVSKSSSEKTEKLD